MKDWRLLSRYADFRDKHRIAVSGDGDRTVVLGNGFGTDQHCWNALMPWLEARCRVIRFDWAIDPEHFDAARYRDIDSYAEDLLAVIDYTGAAPCLFVGHSMSGVIGMIAAQREAGFFDRMVMISPAPRYISDASFPGGFDAPTARALLDQIGTDYMAWVATFAPAIVGDDDRLAVDTFARSLRAMRPDVALCMAKTIFRMDLRDRLAGFHCPTTIIQPSDDPAVPVAVGRYLVERWPQARLNIIEATGHLPHLTEAPRVIAILAEALSL